jgi:2-polyprenyl-6-methoxyphenol hydroxylase-like FAD-dependent oxidoreductase
VLIVGAGPVGLALALALSRAGVAVRIVDKAAHRSTTSKAIGLQYRVSELLAILGVSDRFLAVGGSPTVVNMYLGPRKLAALRFVAPAGLSGVGAFRPQGIMIAQCETERLLGEALAEAGVEIEWSTEFAALSQDDDRVSVQLRGANGYQQVEPAWLIGCGGAHSAIRKQVGFGFEGKSYPMAFLMADVEVEWAQAHGENHVWFHPDGIFAALPFPAPRQWRLFIEVTHRPDIGTLTTDIIKTLMTERTGAAEARLGEPTWLSEFRISRRMVDRMRAGRVLVAGDAAHVHSPMGGQGIATGIQDALNLAWKLCRVIGGAPDALLDSYGAERLPKIRAVLEETDRNAQIFLAPNVALRLLRDLVALPLMRSSFVQRSMFDRLSQIYVSYRGSPLAVHDDREARWRPTRLQAGDRAPDVSFQDSGDASEITLFQCLGSLRPVVLIAPDPRADAKLLSRLCEALGTIDIEAYVVLRQGERPEQPGIHCLIDHHGDLGRLYGMRPGCLCLIRPDGHIGLFQRPIRLNRLRDYLGSICAADALRRAWSEHRLSAQAD